MKNNETLTTIAKQPQLWLTQAKEVLIDSKSVQVLSGVLVLQLAVAGGLLWKSDSQAKFATASQLVSIDPSSVSEITINDGSESISLTLADDQ